MCRRLSLALPAVLLALVAVIPSTVLAKNAPPPPATKVGPVYIQQVALTAKTEKPHGELSGSGSITICVDKGAGTIAFNFNTLVLSEQPTAGHIHKGAVGASGPVVFPFAQPGMIDQSTGELEWADTATVSASTISGLIASPRSYYVNVHSKHYPNGALRGQLGAWKKVTDPDTVSNQCGPGG